MKAFVETIAPDHEASWSFLDRRLLKGIPFEWHHHPEYELTLTLNSHGHRYVGDDMDAYADGDLVLIGPNIPHSWCSYEATDPSRPHVALVAWFSRDWAEGLVRLLPELGGLTALLARAARGVVFSDGARGRAAPLMQAMRAADAPARLVLLLEVLTLLCRDADAVDMANRAAPASASAADARMVRVLDHLHAHFAEPVGTEELAAIACVSPSGLVRLFRRHAHMTVSDYLVRLRIGRACSMLVHGRAAVATIAADVGYTNLSLFNRQFARLKGETPSAFRRRHRTSLAGGAALQGDDLPPVR